MNRTNLGLLIAALCLASFYSWSKLHKLETSDKNYQASRYFPHVKEEDVESIKVMSKDPAFEYILERRADHWYIDRNLLNIEKTHQLVSSVLELTREREMEAEPDAAREKEFRLDAPSYRLEPFKNGGESLGAVRLGARTPDYNEFYGQWEKGGAVHTVPAYTFSVLEEKPSNLVEMSFFPVEVAAVKLLTVQVGESPAVKLQRLEESENFEFVQPSLGRADESAVKDFLFKLNDLKVARFLAASETTELGQKVVSYTAEVGYTDLEIVTELRGRVGANASLLYGQRYFRDGKGAVPVEGTLERFVVEVPAKSELLTPDERLFVDRRVAVFDLDKVTSLALEWEGRSNRVALGKHGQWKDAEGKEFSQDRMNGILWTLRDLRLEEEASIQAASSPEELVMELRGDDISTLELRFGLDKNGKPYLRRGGKTYALSRNSWDALTGAVKKFRQGSE